MATQCTNALRTQLGHNVETFIKDFDKWKAGDEYGAYLFGKDSAYVNPAVANARNVLRHVHLVPLADAIQRREWNRIWQRKGRKTSDRALVYVSDPRHGHLLIYILDEPTAHAVAAMSTPEDRDLMLKFAAVAERFIHSGEILG